MSNSGIPRILAFAALSLGAGCVQASKGTAEELYASTLETRLFLATDESVSAESRELRRQILETTWYAEVAGSVAANRDFVASRIRLWVPHELHPLEEAYIRGLRRSAAIQGVRYASEVLTLDDLAYIYGFNYTAEQLLVQLHGRALFTRCLRDAQAELEYDKMAVSSLFFVPWRYADELEHSMMGQNASFHAPADQ